MAEKKKIIESNKTSRTGESVGRKHRVISDFTKDQTTPQQRARVPQKKARRSG